jgi:splicing factor 3A subunit 3
MPVLEEQRLLHEDLERLEQAISDRILEEPRNIRERLNRDHEIAGFLGSIQDQSRRLVDIYTDADGSRKQEIQKLSTGDPYEEFKSQLSEIKDFHRRYPNEPVENLERAYKRRVPQEGDAPVSMIDSMFTGEEAFGRYFDLTGHHERYLNLPGVRGGRRITYLQYLDVFDQFTPPQCPIKRLDKMREEYFQYVGSLAGYLESFMKKVKPLENLDKFFTSVEQDFVEAWRADKVEGWSTEETRQAISVPTAEGTGEGIWCPDCEKEFKNDNVYKNHLAGKKHIKAAESRKERANGNTTNGNGQEHGAGALALRLKERVVAEREFRVHKLAAAMQTERSDTRVNVERRQGMTEKERQQELEALYAESTELLGQPRQDEDDDEDDEKIYNPLKLPLAWDGKPIPFWLYKLHGLGVEFPCEICGNYVYMGRRAFDKHFNEARHTWGLKALGITSSNLFREITKIEDAQRLWVKLEVNKKKEKSSTENVVQMEDSEVSRFFSHVVSIVLTTCSRVTSCPRRFITI